MEQIKELSEYQVFKTVLKHSLLIIIMPILSFFCSKTFLLDGLFGMSPTSSNVYAAVIAIIVLHAALGAFIYKAYFTGKKVPAKKD
ncbi:hypothetical protein HCN44_004144 [Aphidius gifuensis]|uniref:Vacuolar ATPase assembly integral membrane protein VMA21 homolog n=1 Tax=Aphidius gifuensis TaxID=684658 RepID=A0A834XZW2_APHGI|nr:vacuolar ATPase assembly integral membrane protein VMA21 homolog [Aphidius gifuensis]KAF7994672.1 hypothetical protein HCN44_004144 [Aphidius gifuensis]